MREIFTDGKSLASLGIGDVIHLPRREYAITGLASGGMGHVIFAEMTNAEDNATMSAFSSQVALKISKFKDANLEGELNKWGLMMHPNILLLEAVLKSEEDGLVAVSRMCKGSLGDIIKNERALPEHLAHSIVLSCASALNYAYDFHSIVHLDIKPDNILYNLNTKGYEDTTFYVADWGISSSKILSGTYVGDELFRQTNNNSGTLPYMAPERFLRGRRSGPASDIYSLGIMWLEMIEGILPYQADKPIVEQITTGVTNEAIIQLVSRSEVSNKTKKIILAMTQPNPRYRLKNWKTLIRRLKSLP
jgi:serine/threonine protein kinase